MKSLTRCPARLYNRGFTLIEVLISLIIAVIGIVAILQLQGVFLSTASDSQQRAIATAVAEKKLEELRGFDSINPTSSGLKSFANDIVSSTGTESVTAGSTTYTYNLAWTVTPYTVTSGAISVASAANADFKNVTLNVSWDSGASSVSLSTVIGAINPQISKFIDISGLGGDAPKVDHTPGGAPDVIPIDIGGGETRETVKPLPDVDQSDESTEVKFSTVTYDSSNKLVDQEDFITVNCVCVLSAGTTNGYTPYHHTFDGASKTLGVSAGNIVSAATATVYTKGGSFKQSQLCTRCCAQHHDSPTYDYTAAGVPRYDNTASSGVHNHYFINPDIVSTVPPAGAPAVAGNAYPEACRFRRVDGVYRLFPNWELLTLNTMPRTYLASSASSSLASYQQYVKDTLQDGIYGTSVATSLAGRDFTADNAKKTQLLARGIYMDDMSYDTGWVDYMASVAASSGLSAQDWLKTVPFYEINMTLLATWDSSSDAVATVTSDPIDTIEDDVAAYYGVYSRGTVTMATSGVGSAAIMANSKTDNTGILGNTYANPSKFIGKDNKIIPSPTALSSSVVATIQSCSPTCPIVVSGTVNRKNGLDLSSVAVTITGGVCDYKVLVTTATFNCELPFGSTGAKVISPTTTLSNGYINPIVSVVAPITGTTPGSLATDGTITVDVTMSTGISGIDFDLKK